jgi:hypothetical protein
MCPKASKGLHMCQNHTPLTLGMHDLKHYGRLSIHGGKALLQPQQ